jgi:hypothetical protein
LIFRFPRKVAQENRQKLRGCSQKFLRNRKLQNKYFHVERNVPKDHSNRLYPTAAAEDNNRGGEAMTALPPAANRTRGRRSFRFEAKQCQFRIVLLIPQIQILLPQHSSPDLFRAPLSAGKWGPTLSDWYTGGRDLYILYSLLYKVLRALDRLL